nr:GNAT family N-acetyltransferase [Shewanella sp. Isolate13]
MNIRVLNKDDWSTYRELRLLSLQESPNSFGSSYEQEFLFSSDEWIARLNLDNSDKRALPLIAELNGVAVGLAWGLVHSPQDKTAHIYQMWVSPDVRGQGVGSLLLKKDNNMVNRTQFRLCFFSSNNDKYTSYKII